MLFPFRGSMLKLMLAQKPALFQNSRFTKLYSLLAALAILFVTLRIITYLQGQVLAVLSIVQLLSPLDALNLRIYL